MYHVYKVAIEHNCRPELKPASVYVRRIGETCDIFQYHGKSLLRGLREAAKAIEENENGEL